MTAEIIWRSKVLVKRSLNIAALYSKVLFTPPGRLRKKSAGALVEILYATLTEDQKHEICLPWDYTDEQRGLVRHFLTNHWQVTRPCIHGNFFTATQQSIIFQIFLGLLNPAWHYRFLRELSDDTGCHPWGLNQSIAIFGDPVAGPYQFIITGRHLTLRVNGDPHSPIAFGGPILYAHAATGFYEKPQHPRNVFWPQGLAASALYDMLSASQRLLAEQEELPAEEDIGFRSDPPGAPAAAFSSGQKAGLRHLLAVLLDPFRDEDRADVMRCLDAQGGIEALHLAFGRPNRMSAPDWDDWRLEGPSFIWHYRGWPHVHIWVHIADRPTIAPNTRTGTYIFPEHDPLL